MTVTELQNQGLTKEVIYWSASELPASPFGQERQETLHQAQNSGSSNERHVRFSKENTIYGIDSVPWDSPEPPMKEANDNNKIFTSVNLIQESTQPHDEYAVTQNERKPAKADTAYHLLSGRKRPASEMLEAPPSQKEQRLENISSIKTKHQLKMSEPQHSGYGVQELGDCKEMPIVIDGSSAGEQNQGKLFTNT